MDTNFVGCLQAALVMSVYDCSGTLIMGQSPRLGDVSPAKSAWLQPTRLPLQKMFHPTLINP